MDIARSLRGRFVRGEKRPARGQFFDDLPACRGSTGQEAAEECTVRGGSQPGQLLSRRLLTAIRGKQRIRFTYDGQPRVVEPHALGMDKRGFQALRAYQVAGGSRSGKPQGWKLFHADSMRDIELLPETFPHPHTGYRRCDSPFWSIYAEL